MAVFPLNVLGRVWSRVSGRSELTIPRDAKKAAVLWKINQQYYFLKVEQETADWFTWRFQGRDYAAVKLEGIIPGLLNGQRTFFVDGSTPFAYRPGDGRLIVPEYEALYKRQAQAFLRKNEKWKTFVMQASNLQQDEEHVSSFLKVLNGKLGIICVGRVFEAFATVIEQTWAQKISQWVTGAGMAVFGIYILAFMFPEQFRALFSF